VELVWRVYGQAAFLAIKGAGPGGGARRGVATLLDMERVLRSMKRLG